ncbi:MAG: type II toxin-antitoxin system RelB/DinJ family antitoxin [Propionibacteriaceae bacterium]|jgi:DNA-damage-inducible protein J|nr:type II toxin-antitoxin system RelB/DinJ family antitoxin [Propionibacteriaceae bacterium]
MAAATVSSDRISMRVDKNLKSDAELVLEKLGLNLSDSINLFLRRLVAEQGIPFDLKVRRTELLGFDATAMEARFQAMVAGELSRKRAAGLPIARYDDELRCPYLEHPDGRKEYLSGE